MFVFDFFEYEQNKIIIKNKNKKDKKLGWKKRREKGRRGRREEEDERELEEREEKNQKKGG